MTQVIKPSQMNLLVSSLKNGEVVAFPTETVYGVACQFNDRVALDRLMEAKNRDYSKAITLMLAHHEDIVKYAYVDEKIMRVIKAFMPGRITLVLKKKENVDEAMTNGKETIGIRIPDSDFVLELIARTGPLLVTSANLSGQGNTTNEQEVLAQLDGRIAYVVEGQTSSATASTVVDLSGGDIRMLRTGEITLQQIKEVYDEDSSSL